MNEIQAAEVNSHSGKKGKGDGKIGKKEGQHHNQNHNASKDVVCWHCDKKGQLSTECWSNPKNQSGSGGIPNKEGKEKPKKVKGKGAGSLEHGERAAAVEPQPHAALARSLDFTSTETLVRPPHRGPEGWLTWTHDTGASTSAFPLDARIGTDTQANECSYKTASGELISDRVRVQGTTEYGYGMTDQGRKADFHKTQISASKVHSEGHVAVAASNVGYIIVHHSTLSRKIQQLVTREIVNEPGAIRLYPENDTHITHTQIQQDVRARSDQQVCSMHAKQQSRGIRHSQREVSPTANVGKVHSCLLAQSPETKLQIMPIESEIVDAGIDE